MYVGFFCSRRRNQSSMQQIFVTLLLTNPRLCVFGKYIFLSVVPIFSDFQFNRGNMQIFVDNFNLAFLNHLL